MTADEMFEDLGYKIILNNDEKLIYSKQREFFKMSIEFDKRDFKKTFSAIDSQWIANDSASWVAQDFKNEWDKYCSAQGYWSSMWHEYTMEELQAINKKCKELGWNNE